MAGFFGFIFAHAYQCLDEEVDAPDLAADHDLCRALVAGKAGLHPDAWGNHDPLATQPPPYRKPWRPPIGFPVEQAPRPPDRPQLNKRGPRPDFVRRKPRPPLPPAMWLTYPVSTHTTGEVQLTCDECRKARLDRTVSYGERGRPVAVAAIRAMGHDVGWTCIVGRDRCPQCSQLVPPEAIGNGAGSHQGDEQHH